MSPTVAAAAASSTVCCGGMPSSTATSPNWRSASTSATRCSGAPRHRDRDVDRDRALAHATLRREDDDETAGRAARRSGRRARAVEPRRGARRRGSTDWRSASPSLRPSTVSRAPARSACWRMVGRDLVDREDRAELRVRGDEPVHLLEAVRDREARAEHRDHRPTGPQVLDELFDRLELRRAGELRPEPHAVAGVGLDDRDVIALVPAAQSRRVPRGRAPRVLYRPDGRDRARHRCDVGRAAAGSGTACRSCSRCDHGQRLVGRHLEGDEPTLGGGTAIGGLRCRLRSARSPVRPRAP